MKRDWREAIAKRDRAGCCRICKASPVEAAHVIGRARDRIEGGVAIVDPDSIVPLCKPCHTRYDARSLDLLPYLSVKEQAQAVRDAGGIVAALRRITPRETP